MRYSEIEALALCHGFEHARSRGSHRLFRHQDWPGLLNFQEWRGGVAAYQVRQLLAAIEELEGLEEHS
ncbi:MAG TPA: type II toxin-antitoxin system HicA family toxin [Longimicrobiales bacterium]|nr:type II toxin-antitoxin system HicA family toxin [Longimicrobiales bacterium]